MKNKTFSTLLMGMLLMLCSTLSHAENLNIAVAANFKQTLEALKQDFEKSSPHTITIISASTGQLVQQISQHAPFDILLAANTAHPQLLWQHIHESRNLDLAALSVYAKGRLVFYSNIDVNQTQTINDILNDERYKRLSIANSILAPYGLAAMQTLTCLNQQQWQTKLVIGQNVAQALQFIDSQSVDGGFVALSQVLKKDPTRIRYVDEGCYNDINQMALRLNNKPASFDFMNFLNSQAARSIIENHGYYLPN